MTTNSRVISAYARVATIFGALALSANGARAADATPWVEDLHSSMRLIAAATAQDDSRRHRAGIEIKLAPGWHTYWRYPGDAGVPPQFDFAGSKNVKAVTVLWPAPRRMTEAGLSVIGYLDHLILPLRISPQEADKPVVLKLKLDYAVCEKLCLPVEARAELAISGGKTALDEILARAEALVPAPSKVGDARPLAIRSAQLEAGGGKPRIVVDVAAPKGAKVDLFAEGPTPEWTLPLPMPVADAPSGLRRFSFELDGLPAGAHIKGAALKFTAVSDTAAIEATTHLD